MHNGDGRTSGVAASSSSRRPEAARTGISRSVVANWIWYGFVLISGFILPRLIDRTQGREVLGLWDVAWSLVVYVQMLGLSIGSAVSPYVARYRGRSAWDSMNVTINTSLAMLTVSGVLGLVMGGLFAWAAPAILSDAPPNAVVTAQRVVLLLSATAALQLPGGVFNGVITGFERFDWLNTIRITRDAGILIAGAGVLLAGGGIVALAAVVLGMEILGQIAKWFVARRLCPHVSLATRWITRDHARELLVFGGKSVVQSVAHGGIYQGSSLLVATFLGPAMLAVYSRQSALVLHAMRFVKQYAQVFIPRSSAIEAMNDRSGLAQTLILATRYGFYISLPILLALLILGGELLEIWMGRAYVAPAVLSIMTVGHMIFVPQMVAYSVLTGMGRHGLPALLDLAAAVASILIGLAVLAAGGGLVGAALAMTVPLTISAGVVTPWFACRRVGLPFDRYLAGVLPGPLALAGPGALCLVASRWMLDGAAATLLAGAATGGLVTLMLYWQFVVPESFRAAMTRRICWWRRAHVGTRSL